MTSNSSDKSGEYSDYKKALEAVKEFNDPPSGFVKLTEPFVTATEIRNIVKQNNTIIELLIGLHKKIDFLKTTTSQASEIDKITQKLEKLTLRPTPKKGPFYVFKDPKKIFEEEKEKLKRKSS